MKKSCPRCGKHFESRHNEISRCQCTSVSLNYCQKNYIDSLYNDCLCTDCLCTDCLQDIKKSIRPPKAVFNWSGGKDSALALWKILQGYEYEVIALLTTVNKQTERSSMHGIPLSLLYSQAESIGIPLYPLILEPDGEINGYEEAMKNAILHFKKLGIKHFIFGDIFLHDVKKYREKQLAPFGIAVVEPLWGKSSSDVMEEFLASGLRTIIVTTTADKLDKNFIGKHIDRELINLLPADTDPCGENGEYHTFCYAGGMFRYPVDYSLGEPRSDSFPVKMEDGREKVFTYWFADLESSEKE